MLRVWVAIPVSPLVDSLSTFHMTDQRTQHQENNQQYFDRQVHIFSRTGLLPQGLPSYGPLVGLGSNHRGVCRNSKLHVKG